VNIIIIIIISVGEQYMKVIFISGNKMILGFYCICSIL
jgi:hypothetical protein